MIIIKLKGGLGNQMFQYALGRSLSLERKAPLFLVQSHYLRNENRKFELDQFNIPNVRDLPKFIYKLPPFSRNRGINILYNRLDKHLPRNLRFAYTEAKNGFFDARILKLKGSKYLDGYWQSEKYFETIKSQLRADFTLRQPLAPQDQTLADEMSANPRSVSVHIRRGDYISDFQLIGTFYICTPDYYAEAMRLMQDKLGKGVIFYIFSDDPDWCRTGIDYSSDFKIVSDGQRSASHELVMMSRCRNAIMANSSFSWWGAWLSPDPKKIVIYPKKWFYKRETPDIPLSNWIAFQHNTENDWKYIDIPYAKSRYLMEIGQELNLDDPQRFTEKLQWLKIYDRRPIYTALADKVAVRDYVAEKIGSQYLTKVYGIYEKSSEIEWDKLPNKFVLKTNHGSHWVILYKDKHHLDKAVVSKKLDAWIGKNYYYYGREWQYKDIPPKIICEEYLEGDEKLGLLEYKFWCFNGQPKCIEVIADRYKKIKRSIYNLDWQKLDLKITYPVNENEIPCPKQLPEMVEKAKLLSDNFPFVRVDLYNFDTRTVFGEMTFTPGGGFQVLNPPEFDFRLGKELILP